MTNALDGLLSRISAAGVDPALLAYAANLQLVALRDPGIAASIVDELENQRSSIKLIASENYSSIAVQAAMANLLTDKYAEGVPGRRYYSGCDNVDAIETLARDRAQQLFGADHAYVQPHSGADANLVAFWAILSRRVELPALAELGLVTEQGVVDAQRFAALSAEQWEPVRRKLGDQKLLALDFACGGHLTHGYRQNVSGRMFQAHQYQVSRETGLLDYDQIADQARAVRPTILLAGYSAYPGRIDFARMRQIADDVGAVLMVDMAHFAGLVAGKVFTGDADPVPFAQVVTTTTHKTLRGPRGGLALADAEFGPYLDKGCPLVQGGPLPHVMAAKAICFGEALEPAFRDYAARVVTNAKTLADCFADTPIRVLTGTTENHLVICEVTASGLSGRQAEDALRECGLTMNRNAIPFDSLPPLVTSGLRLGTPAMTTVGMGADEMREIASILVAVLGGTKPAAIANGPRAGEPSRVAYELDSRVKEAAHARVADLLASFPVYPELDIERLRELTRAPRA